MKRVIAALSVTLSVAAVSPASADGGHIVYSLAAGNWNDTRPCYFFYDDGAWQWRALPIQDPSYDTQLAELMRRANTGRIVNYTLNGGYGACSGVPWVSGIGGPN